MIPRLREAERDDLPLSPRLHAVKLPYSEQIDALAGAEIFLGTSSWKYPGWLSLLYDEGLYLTKGKFSNAKFERECLREYAASFPTVCVDAGYYQFPSAKWLEPMCEQVPAHFKFGFKVTEEITLFEFLNLPRYGNRAGRRNEHFLDADLFVRAFLEPLEPFRTKIGPLMFEFSAFQKTQFEHGRQFVEALDAFLGRLPSGWEYCVELRNPGWLQPEYFAVLRRHGVAHVLNNWTRMPTVEDQLALEGSQTASFDVARFLTARGTGYQASVDAFQPYDRLQAPDEPARAGLRKLLAGSLQKRRRCYVYVNNRLEGSAPRTIEAALAAIAEELAELKARPQIISIRPEGSGWVVWIAEDFTPLYREKADAISFAQFRAGFGRYEVHLFKEDGTLEEIWRSTSSNNP
jgi:uncharacterized protein YecE (DUF72 family)